MHECRTTKNARIENRTIVGFTVASSLVPRDPFFESPKSFCFVRFWLSRNSRDLPSERQSIYSMRWHFRSETFWCVQFSVATTSEHDVYGPSRVAGRASRDESRQLCRAQVV